MTSIDINCDMGESFGLWKMGQDAEVMPFITSANIACGAHASDPNVMAATIGMANKYGVSIGAHPGFADLQGFGRRPIRLASEEIRNLVLYQLGALWGMLRPLGISLHHVKPHGALYNMACADNEIALPVVAAIKAFSAELPVYCLPNSNLERHAREMGLEAVAEGFADRAYKPNGSLADRISGDAVTSDAQKAAQRALQLANGSVTCVDGTTIRLNVRTICVHGDTPGAPQIAQAVRTLLSESGFSISSALKS